jgi:hypothetical protein
MSCQLRGLAKKLLSREIGVASLTRIVLSPAAAFLLLSEMSRAGWISFQVFYSRMTITFDFLGSLDTPLWVLVTVALGLAAAAGILKEGNRSACTKFLFVALTGAVLAFLVAAALGLLVPAITVGALVYLIDLAQDGALIVPGWSSRGTKILSVCIPTASAFALAIVAQLLYPASHSTPGAMLPWLFSKAVQLTVAFYHILDPFTSALYAVLLLLPFVLLLAETIHLDGNRVPGRHKTSSELGSCTTLGIVAVVYLLGSVMLLIPCIATGGPVGVDFGWYINSVRELSRLPTSELANAVFSLFHSLTLLIALLLRESFHFSPELAVQLTIQVVALSTASSAGWFTLQATRNRGTAVLSVLFSLFSIRTTVGYFAGILANWLALTWVFAALALLVRLTRKRQKRDLVFVMVLNMLTFFTHVETWMMLSLLMLLIGLWYKDVLTGTCLIVFTLGLMASGNVAFVSRQVVHMSAVIGSFSLQNPGLLLSNLGTLGRYFMIGLFTDPLLLLLSILGLAGACLGVVPRIARFSVVAWTGLCGLFVLFIAPEFAWRGLYQIPYEPLAAIGASMLWQATDAIDWARLGSGSYLSITVLLTVCLATIDNGIRAFLILAGF